MFKERFVKRMLIRSLVGAALVGLCCWGCSSRDENTLKMVTEATFPPYEFLRGGEVVGVDVEICRAVAEKLGKQFAVENVDFDSVIPSVISEKADLAAAGITVTEDRKQSVDFSDVYAKTEIVLIYRKDKPVLTADDCKGKRIGVQSGNTAETIVLEQFQQEPERFRSAPDVEPAKNCVKGEDDLAIAPTPINLEEYAIAIRKGRPELLKAVNEVIAELKASGRIESWKDQYRAEADAMKE